MPVTKYTCISIYFSGAGRCVNNVGDANGNILLNLDDGGLEN